MVAGKVVGVKIGMARNGNEYAKITVKHNDREFVYFVWKTDDIKNFKSKKIKVGDDIKFDIIDSQGDYRSMANITKLDNVEYRSGTEVEKVERVIDYKEVMSKALKDTQDLMSLYMDLDIDWTKIALKLFECAIGD